MWLLYMRDVAVIALDLLALLGRGRTRIGEHDVDRLARQPARLMDHAPEPQIVLEADRLAGLGPAPALPHIFVAGARQDAFGGVGERARLAPGALEIGMLEARQVGLVARVRPVMMVSNSSIAARAAPRIGVTSDM